MGDKKKGVNFLLPNTDNTGNTPKEKQKVVICHKNQPDVELTRNQMQAIVKELTALYFQDNSSSIGFENTEIRVYDILLTCLNNETKKWLERQIPILEKSLSIDLKIQAELPFVYELNLETAEVASSKAFIEEIKKRKPSLNAGNWEIVYFRKTKNGGANMKIQMALNEEIALKQEKCMIPWGLKSFQMLNRKSVQDKEGWKVIVCHKNHPDTKFSYDDLKEIKRCIKKTVMGIQSGKFCPKFENTQIGLGTLEVECTDEESKNWLLQCKAQLQYLKQEFVIIRERLKYLYKFQLNDHDHISSREFLEKVEQQNTKNNIYTKDWIVVEVSSRDKDKNTELYVEMTSEGRNSLKDNKVHFGTKLIKFQEVTYDSMNNESESLEEGFPCNMVIFHKDHPLTRLIKDDAMKLKQKFMLDLKNENQSPIFEGFSYNKGCLFVNVPNEKAKKWLSDKVNDYKTDKLDILIKKAENHLIELIVFHGGLEKPSEFLSVIRNQNPSLAVDSWRLIGIKDVKPGDIDGQVGLFLEVDENSIDRLSGQKKISFGFEKVDVTIVTRDIEKAMKRKYKIKDD